jgi:uncharacterized membrane protein YdfJ with MMPL/SSD domain
MTASVASVAERLPSTMRRRTAPSRPSSRSAAGATIGVVRGLAATGGVITSAGVVLAATFAVLGVLPLIALTEIGFLVAFGVLVDTVLVRSALVPALAIDIGPLLWWPSALATRSRAGDSDGQMPVHCTGSLGPVPGPDRTGP